ncbi:hypothetical protein COY52_10030 [Candidatus Desantisbacteria bacterium CG_4_10_14_0_8_um_filter_48_22]|uniref:Glycosyl hydrolases family 2 sugar binding domain-containing protein n=1 Tax=Candidatus Desantisbacteria bacterium CG_4_10_14_0_8_um_filter_48_22 TaxID=1974543 RepID=A0A2M7S785_9BACT|nr:MAG: hypothetical protein AUJ67_07770 [Candidatus Desantisbacteria bacterium CG1_02_49_89]PIV56304.1 MAG: hypothetical protein COS16_04415 [Candidatus Desantisbacteria bacterium CG02_land_8_20_14_3_00_49_13]PIZ15329.1 MAG: hypothetical protein COY52_10030 [Candidatus Desantisbacteria bacterium CG_4_10_14_0_8_um_filter_48_22]
MPEFTRPDSFYWPGYIWFWNDRLSVRALSSQLRDMNRHKAKSVWPLPTPRDFRPDSMPTSLDPDYLSKEYLKRYKYAVKEAHRLGMKVWLYDEGGWPSGSACGRIVKENPALAQQYLCRREIKPKPKELVKVPGNCLSAFLYHGPSFIRRLIPGQEIKISRAGFRLEIFSAGRADATRYPDLLNPEATREFIRLTHEAYKKTAGNYFGNTIPLVFTDEPKVANPPWTNGLDRDFRRKKGYDIIKKLPAIFGAGNREGMRARIDFYDWWSRRFAGAYFGQIQRWCRKNDLLSAGHLGGEDDTLGSGIYGYGHILRILRKFDIPGVDTIWRQIFPGTEKRSGNAWGAFVIARNHHFPKYASTAAHQEGTPWALTESFCVYGSGLTPAHMKWITDFQYVRGINIMTIGSYPLSTKGYYMAGQRPMFCPSNPLWKYMEEYHTYTARLSYLLSLGRPVIETAVYYPVRDIWAGGPDAGKIAGSNDALAKTLLENQRDFDFIDDDILERKSTRVVNGRLKAGRMEYRAVCVSRSGWMSEKSKAKLSEFASRGGRVLRIDNRKNFKLTKYINPLVCVEPRNSAVRVCKRKLENGSLYFLSNEGTGKVKCTIRFAEDLPMVRIDPETGKCCKPSGAFYSKGMWALPLSLEFAGSCVIFFTREDLHLAPAPLEAGQELLSIKTGWSLRGIRSYRIGKRDFEIDELDKKPVPARLGDWTRSLGKDFSGDAEYSAEFECGGVVAECAGVLDLGEVRYACQVSLNGKDLGKSAWQPFSFPVKGLVKKGKNRLKIIVTNTLANQFVTTRVFDRYRENVIGPYHKIALNFEPDSMPSGLFGPVRIMRCPGSAK